MLFEAHARAFAVFGGVTKRGIYDNMKTAVDKVGDGKKRTINARFEEMSGHYLFDPNSATVRQAGRKALSRRAFKIADGASGVKPASGAGTHLKSSMPGCKRPALRPGNICSILSGCT